MDTIFCAFFVFFFCMVMKGPGVILLRKLSILKMVCMSEENVVGRVECINFFTYLVNIYPSSPIYIFLGFFSALKVPKKNVFF